MTWPGGLRLIRYGSCTITLGVLLGWASDQPVGSFVEVDETLELFFLASGTFVVLIGCIVFCIKGQASRVVLAGSVASAACLLLIPTLASLAHFEPNVHDWTGLLFFLWLLSCLVGPAILLVGLVRFLRLHHRVRQP